MATLNDNLKKTIDDLDLDRRLQQLGEFAQKTVADVKAQAGTLAHDKRDKVDELLARATDALDQRTNGKLPRQGDQVQRRRRWCGRQGRRPAARRARVRGWVAGPAVPDRDRGVPSRLTLWRGDRRHPDATGCRTRKPSASTADGTDGQSKAWYAE